ncbi:MAG: nucleoside 2-deoxyribosyltransferase [Vicinamibacterales bacterium]
MIIYLACTVRGDRGAVAALRALVSRLEGEGHRVLTKHLLDDDVETSEAQLSEQAVYSRDIGWLEACNLLIADASGSSYGVGFEVGYVLGRADGSDQRVILLYRADRKDRISRLISGNAHPRCWVVPYDGIEDLVSSVLARL